MLNPSEAQGNEYNRGPYHWFLRKSAYNLYITRANILLSKFAPKNKILDIGCGDGFMSKFLVQNGMDVVGIDINEKAICLAKILVPTATFYNLDALELKDKFKDNSFDGIIAQEFFEHIPIDLRRKIIDSCFEILKPGGWVALSVPTKKRPLDVHHYSHFDEAEIRRLLSSFNEVEVIGFVPNWIGLNFVKKFCEWPSPVSNIFNFYIRKCNPNSATRFIVFAHKV